MANLGHEMGNFRLVLVLDCTGSMSAQLSALLPTLKELVQVFRLLGRDVPIGILAYRDYCDPWVTKYEDQADKLQDFIGSLRADGGGDAPEAAKTAARDLLNVVMALNKNKNAGTAATTAAGGAARPQVSNGVAIEQANSQAAVAKGPAIDKPSTRTVVLWYTDAPPHCAFSQSDKENVNKEQAALGEDYDWCRLCSRLAANNTIVYPILNMSTGITPAFFGHMAHVTGGETLLLRSHVPSAFAHVSVALLMSVLGYTGTAVNSTNDATAGSGGESGDCQIQMMMRSAESRDVQGLAAVAQGVAVNEEAQLKDAEYSWGAVDVPSLFPKQLSLINLFKRDEAYQATVFSVFDYLLHKDRVTSLRLNSLFASMWRQCICASRRDERVPALLNKFSAAVQQLGPGDAAGMKEFLADSYNRVEEIRELIDAVPMDKRLPALVVDAHVPHQTCSEVLELFRSCNRTSLATIRTFITSLLVIGPNTTTATATTLNADADGKTVQGQESIPLALSDRDLFSVLLHLITPGMRVSTRAAVTLAMVVVVTSTETLLARAKKFLAEQTGSWFEADVPENYSHGFLRLALRAQSKHERKGEGQEDGEGLKILTPAERAMMSRLYVAGNVKANELTSIKVEVPFSSCLTVRPDHKITCTECHEPRSFTLITEGGRCALCLQGEVVEAPSLEVSSWCECVTCQVHYVVERPSLLKAHPKCHGCRNQMHVPSVRCTSCYNTFSYPIKGVAAIKGGFTCPPCKVSRPTNDVYDVAIRELLPFMPEVEGYTIGDVDRLFKTCLWHLGKDTEGKIFSMESSLVSKVPAQGGEAKVSTPLQLVACDPEVAEEAAAAAMRDLTFHAASQAVIEEPGLTWVKKPVLNLAIVRRSIADWVASEKAEVGLCGLCFRDVPKRALLAVCGRSRCSATACRDCLDAWYGIPAPGKTLTLANLHCPFCKKRPAPRTQLRHNRAVCTLRLGEVVASTHYAWCMDCNRAKAVGARECMAAAPEVDGYVCGECAAVRAERIDAGTEVVADCKACPSCGAQTEKESGCDHMECPQCEQHWCYYCADYHSAHAEDVYEHMNEVHGGIGLY